MTAVVAEQSIVTHIKYLFHRRMKSTHCYFKIFQDTLILCCENECLSVVIGMSLAHKSLYEALRDTYEEDWPHREDINNDVDVR